MPSTPRLKGRGLLRNIAIVWALITETEHSTYAGWYNRSHNDVVGLADFYGIDLWRTCQVVSAISPAKLWGVNVDHAGITILAWDRYKTFEERQQLFRQNRVGVPYGWYNFQKAWDVLDGKVELSRKGAPKTYDFALNLYEPYQHDLPVVDSHIARLWRGSLEPQGGSIQIPAPLYEAAADDIRHLANDLGLPPERVQEEVWQKHIDMLVTGVFPNDLGYEW